MKIPKSEAIRIATAALAKHHNWTYPGDVALANESAKVVVAALLKAENKLK